MSKGPKNRSKVLPEGSILEKIPQNSDEVPVTRQFVLLVAEELRSEMRSGFRAVDARFGQVDEKINLIDGRFSSIEARFNQIDARFNQIDARFDSIEAKLETMNSQLARALVMWEEQRNENRIVLEGLTGLFERQNRVETRVTDVEKFVRTIGRGV